MQLSRDELRAVSGEFVDVSCEHRSIHGTHYVEDACVYNAPVPIDLYCNRSILASVASVVLPEPMSSASDTILMHNYSASSSRAHCLMRARHAR